METWTWLRYRVNTTFWNLRRHPPTPFLDSDFNVKVYSTTQSTSLWMTKSSSRLYFFHYFADNDFIRLQCFNMPHAQLV
ncbi:hypothetical protein GDO86_003759 [Hymenochirus boettgeri]|uniref:Uncharacterized protein n=1 Tax=Hymenochirus boettgeri TaxID=247094 RepID=A0A8T2K5C0_9PIPI|nr:hypothetical protein GDO86_003759 [Hymenochirus boettgeri]